MGREKLELLPENHDQKSCNLQNFQKNWVETKLFLLKYHQKANFI